VVLEDVEFIGHFHRFSVPVQKRLEKQWRWAAAKKRDCSMIISLFRDDFSTSPHMFVKNFAQPCS
jgi:hypothetical protein